MRKLSITDVAKRAGVSTTTVSRVLNNVATVSADNRRRVLGTIRTLRYHPNPSAQRLAGGAVRRTTVGLILPRFEDMFHSFYISELLKGIGAAAERLKLDVLLHVTSGDAPLEIVPVDGLLFADIDGNEDQLDWVLDHKLPCVVMNHYLAELPVSCVAVDNHTATIEVVQYLAGLGHREIATITGHLRTPVGLERLEGYLEGMKTKGLPVKPYYVENGDYSASSAWEPAKRLLSRRDRPTAIVAASDAMAITTIDVATRMGLRVPEDVSVIGFDDSPLAAFARVPLTSVWLPLSRIGELSVEIIHNALSGKSHHPVKRLLGARLVERQSCRQTWLEQPSA